MSNLSPTTNSIASQSLDDIFHQLASSANGLTQDAAAKKLLAQQRKNGWSFFSKTISNLVQTWVRQWLSPLIWLLVLAAFLAISIGAWKDGIAMLAVILLTTILGFVQEYKAEKAVSALQALAPKMARVRRENEIIELPADEVVAGDIIVLAEGNIVPADARLIKSTQLTIVESILTGESQPQHKTAASASIAHKSLDKQQEYLVFQGTQVVGGSAIAVVLATTDQTQFGGISRQVTENRDTATPLQSAISKLSGWLAIVAVVMGLPIVFLGVAGGQPALDMIMLAISLIVSAIPEGLAVVLTVTLSLAALKLAKRNVIIRQLTAVEALGSTDVICTDKTGTLTQNKLHVAAYWLPSEMDTIILDKPVIADSKNNHQLLTAMLLASQDNTIDPTEMALQSCAKKSLGKTSALLEIKEVASIAFSSERQFMASTRQIETNKFLTFIKGAPEKLIKQAIYLQLGNKKTTMTERYRQDILDKVEELTGKGWRVLAFSQSAPTNPTQISTQILHKSVFLGLVALADPVRSDAAHTIKQAQEAGVRVLILSGDHPLTTKNIGEQVGLTGQVITGQQLSKMDRTDLTTAIKENNLFARVTPEQKMLILQVLTSAGQKVAMTGDGVNDAPALKKAHVGIALGSGTDLAKATADLILADDNLKNIIGAIKAGRATFFNIKTFIVFMLATNIDEALVIMTALIFGLPLPFLPIHLLWLNMISDSLPALALTQEKLSADIIPKLPTNAATQLFTGIIAFSLAMGAMGLITTITLFTSGYYILDWTLNQAQTVVFCATVFFELFTALAVKIYRGIPLSQLLNNKYLNMSLLVTVVMQVMIVQIPLLNNIFSTSQLNIWQWMAAASAAGIGVISVEILRYLKHTAQANSSAILNN